MLEYIENNADTHKVHSAPPKPAWAEVELVRIAGLNRHNQPNLRLIWGGTALSETIRQDKHALKYHCGYSKPELKGYEYYENGERKFAPDLTTIDDSVMAIPVFDSEELGLLRWVIESWTSPEELERQGRFKTAYAPGEITPILRDFPRQGIYDCYYIVENRMGLYRDVEQDVMTFIKAKWKYEQLPFHETEAERDAIIAKQNEAKEKAKDELWQAALNGDLRLPDEERERREHYWATKDDYAEDLARIRSMSAFYQTR